VSGSSKAFLVVLVVLGMAVGAAFAFLNNGLGGGDTFAEGETVVFEVPEGMSTSQMAQELEEEGVIRSALAFRLAARDDERSSRIQPGTYELVSGMSAEEILEVVSTRPEGAEVFRVTIPEGWTTDQILDRLADASPRHSREDFDEGIRGVALPDWVPDLPEEADAFEGLLFPDTYDFVVDADPQQILARLLEQTEAVLDQVELPADFDRYEVLILASLVERETRVREEQRTVASVLHNRLDLPMRLQIDATVQYARGEHTDRVLFSDLEIDSPWNTYQHDGLPPTPISNAGRAAIQAAADPEDTSYLFYVVDDIAAGTHVFAETLEEHNRNVAEFRRRRAEAEAQAQD
jgi:UPF0755 protein